MDRDSILERYSYNHRRYNIEDSKSREQQEMWQIQKHKKNLERRDLEETRQFKKLRYIDKELKIMLYNLLLKLKRHESLQEKIEWACENAMDTLKHQCVNKQDSEKIMGHYCEAFYIEKMRCIDTFEIYLSIASNSFAEFKQTLRTFDLLNLNHPILKSHHTHLVKRCHKLVYMCGIWHRLLLQEDFNDDIRRPIFVY